MQGILIITIALCFLLMYLVNTYNNLQNLVIKINEVEASIDSILRKRFDLLNKSVSIIKEIEPEKDQVLNDIEKLRSKKLSNFELDRKIYEGINEFSEYKVKFPNLRKNEEYINIEKTIENTENELTACRNYYNDTITNYNKKVSTFPSIVVAKITKNKQRPYYDGKNMYDEVYNDFKL